MPTKEAAEISFVAGGAGLGDFEKNGIRVAIDMNRSDQLDVPARRAFAPKLLSRATEIDRVAGTHGFFKALLIHPSEHEDFARHMILSDRRKEPIDSTAKVRIFLQTTIQSTGPFELDLVIGMDKSCNR